MGVNLPLTLTESEKPVKNRPYVCDTLPVLCDAGPTVTFPAVDNRTAGVESATFESQVQRLWAVHTYAALRVVALR